MHDYFLKVENLRKQFGGIIASNGISLDIIRGETHALIGPNGAGKTTLISQLQGDLVPDSGRIILNGVDVTRNPAHTRAAAGVARSFQISSVFPEFTVEQNVAMAVQARVSHSFRFWQNAGKDAVLRDQAREALDILELNSRADVLAAELSHGERRQLELAMALAMKPRLLLLDEPLAGMGREDGLRITEILKRLKSQYTILLVEHDMDAVFSLSDRISVLVAGQCIVTGSPAEVRTNEKVRAAYLGHGD